MVGTIPNDAILKQFDPTKQVFIQRMIWGNGCGQMDECIQRQNAAD